jgi:hypothetical protein
MRIEIAGIVCSFSISDPWFEHALSERYSAFLTEDRPMLSLEFVKDDSLASQGPYEVPAQVERIAEGRDAFRLSWHYDPFDAVVDLDAGTGTFRMRTGIYCFDAFLRVLYSILLARSGGALVHGAAVKTARGAWLMVGMSGAGKSTLCQQGFETVLGNELVAIRREGEGFRVCGTPFWGDSVPGRVSESAELVRLCMLRKGGGNTIAPARRADALMTVLACAIFFGPPELSGSVLHLCSDLVETTFHGALHFEPTPAIVPLIEGEVLANAV